MAEVHFSEQQTTFQPFSWLNSDARRYPLADFVTKAHDISSGIACVLELLEDSMLREIDGGPQLLTLYQRGALLRYSISSATLLQDESSRGIEWLNTRRPGEEQSCDQ